MIFSVHLWSLVTGALAGAAAVYFSKGRGKIVKAALVGAIIAVIMGFLRGLV